MLDRILTDLLQNQNPDGGWGALRAKRSNTESTALAVMALKALAETTAADNRKRGIDWLVRHQNQDHSWPLNEAAKEGSWTTALAITALTDNPENNERVLAAARWLLEQEAASPAFSPRSFYGLPASRRYLPETLFNSDLLVSMPKLKTHHWAGVTLSMKNMFGIVPGAVYGWPKNILHWQGIDNSILDINSSLPLPQFAIVDGIVGMQGNGPLQGQAKASGVLVFGDDFVSVDASAARLMKLEPRKINYLAKADEFLGNLAYERIEQIGEKLEKFEQDFDVIESLEYLKKITG